MLEVDLPVSLSGPVERPGFSFGGFLPGILYSAYKFAAGACGATG